MPMNEEWVSGDYGRPIQIDTEITDLTPWATYQIKFYDPLGTLINTYTATNPSAGILQYTPTLADTQTPDFLLVKSGVWKAIPVLSNAGTALLRATQAMLINVKPEGKEG